MVQFFPNPEDMEIIPLLLMMIFYGYILLNASKLMSDGCELLLLLFGPGIIGGLVIPTLGAVPDSIMILMSGIKSGTPDEIQAQITVGVGTLVGSTVMLITIPWGASVYLGRRDLDPATGMAVEKAAGGNKKTVYTSFSWTSSCVSTLSDIPTTAKIMLVATVNYLVVQLPVFAVGADRGRDGVLAAFVLALIGFVVYCLYQYLSNAAEERERAKQEMLRFNEWKHTLHSKQVHGDWVATVFHQFDADHSGHLALSELSEALQSLGLKVTRRDAAEIFKAIDVGADGKDSVAGDGKLSLAEFRTAVKLWVTTGQSLEEVKKAALVASLVSAKSLANVHSGAEITAAEGKESQHAKPAETLTAGHLQSSHNEPLPGAHATAEAFANAASPLQAALRRRLHGSTPAADLLDYSMAKTAVKQSLMRSTRASVEEKDGGAADGSERILAKKGSAKRKEIMRLEENEQRNDDHEHKGKVQDTAVESAKVAPEGEEKNKQHEDGKEVSGTDKDKDYGTFPAGVAKKKSEAAIELSHQKEENGEEKDEEEEEEEDDHWELTETQLKYKAVTLLSVGTILLIIFSDPMVDVLSSLGNAINISPFYVSFVITPLASNAAEVMASVIFARKKTNASISLTLSALHGAATMNATIALGVFTALVYFRELRWSFSAEVMAVVLVTIIVGANAMRRTIYMWQAALVVALYPLCIVFVAVLEEAFGVD